jgi:hypothetical protein
MLDQLIDLGRVKITRIGPMPYVDLRDLYPLAHTTNEKRALPAQR